jgi:ABC-2 type transport system ATP-binding protein
VIEVNGLTKRFGRILAVEDLSFRAEPGRVTGFLGPNGAGKTTTLRALVALLHPTAGTATILDRPYAQLEEPVRVVGAVLEASGFHPGRSGRNHLRTLATAGGIAEPRVDEVLALVDLTGAANRRTRGYSLGMKQRLALAGALLGDPRVLVLDEPANGLDPQGIRWLRDLLRALAREGRTVLVSSHVLAEVAQLADDVVIIARGRLLAQGTVDEIVARAGRGTRVRAPERDRLADELRRAGLKSQPFGEDGLVVADAPPATIGEIAASEAIALHELSAESGSLEEAFLELTEGASTP